MAIGLVGGFARRWEPFVKVTSKSWGLNGKPFAYAGRESHSLTSLEKTPWWKTTGWEVARRGRPDLWPLSLWLQRSPLAVLVPHEGGGVGHGVGDGGVVRTRGWGRGPARRGLTLRAFDLTL